jgi:hypothetical protein
MSQSLSVPVPGASPRTASSEAHRARIVRDIGEAPDPYLPTPRLADVGAWGGSRDGDRNFERLSRRKKRLTVEEEGNI